MNILLTGATGFLGSHLLPALIKRGYKVIIFKRSFSDLWRIKSYFSQIKRYDVDKVDIEKVFQDNRIDIIIHLATDYGRKNYNNIIEMLEPNIKLPSQLLSLGVKYGVKAFINTDTSTDCRYTLYSAMKKAFIQIAKFFTANYEIKFVNVISEYMYGERDDNTKFVSFLMESVLKDKEIKATGGEQKRDFIYVKDVASAYLAVLDNIVNFNDNYIEFNIGTGHSVSLKDFVKIVEKVGGGRANVQWGAVPFRKNEIFDSRADVSIAQKLLNWQPKTSLEEGLRNTINWYKNE